MANITKPDVDATVEEIVSAQVQEVLTAEMVVPGTIMDMSSEVGPGMDKLKIPKYGNFTVQNKAAGTPLTPQLNAFTSDDLDLDKHQAVPFLIEDLASLQSKIALAQQYVNQAAKDMAAKMDADIITDMVGSASAAAPDHLIAYETPSDLAKNDVLNARQLLNEANVSKADRTLLTAPDDETDLMKIPEFTRVDESGGSEALRNGQIGKLFGFDVVVSSQMTANVSLFYHRSTAAFARQLTPRSRQDLSILDIGQTWVIDHVWGIQAGLDSGKRIVEVNATGA